MKQTRSMTLNAKALGLTTGVFAGIIWLVLLSLSVGTGYAKDMIMLMGSVHPGFAYSYAGAVWLGILHLITGFILGYLFAWMYNKLS